MPVSAGNLDALVGFWFAPNQFVGATVESFAQAADGTVLDVLAQTLPATSGLAVADPTSNYVVTSVSDSTNQIVINQFSGNTFVRGLTYTVLGFNSISVLVSPLSMAGLIGALQNGQSVVADIGIISRSVLAGGTGLAFAPDGTFAAVLACFALGTRILTDAGEVAVEEIEVGDFVPGQVSNNLRQVRWVGRRTVQVAGHPRPWDVAPVRIRAGALAPGRPHRDVFLSPDHAVLVEGCLIPVRYLVNGATIRQEMRDSITYLHIELDIHDVLLAEGLPCESFLDTGNRAAFAATPAAPPLHRNTAALGARPHG